MKRAYFECNAINFAVDKSLTANDLIDSFNRHAYQPVVGMHTIYEPARIFFVPGCITRGTQLLSFLQKLDASIMPPSWDLLQQEILKLRHGTSVLPFLSHLNQTSTRYEIMRLASGIFDVSAQTFIGRREANIRANYPQFAQEYIDRVIEAKQTDPAILRKLRTFEDIYKVFKFEFPSMIIKILEGRVKRSEAVQMCQRLDSFPVLRSTVLANLYLSFLCIRNKVRPGFDKLDDYCHAIEASYCDVLVTNDSQLIHAARYINPDLTILRCSDLT